MFYYKSEEHFVNFLRKHWGDELDFNQEWFWIRKLYLKAEKGITFYREVFNKFTYMLKDENKMKKLKILELKEVLMLESGNKKYKILQEMNFIRKYDFDDFFKYTI